ncbi:HD-GYP domain-containing protein [Teredinibacter haidensis]|uniref:HD-GYP domain-containing protein n=1 Tax=Teredinibacter haidensis TaxID=2731755 RepID=UPI000948A889|nr:HD domain-containing phosphohydrolase [Teredinibacter haidensis]
MNCLFGPLLNALNLVVLKQGLPGETELLTEIPPSMRALFSGNIGEPLSYLREMHFLENFSIDAGKHWAKRVAEPLRSGPWIEDGGAGRQLALEASAIFLDGERLLLIEDLGEKYQNDVRMLQEAREHLLVEECLELEVQKRTAQLKHREEQIAFRLLAAAGYRDEETGAHIRRIGLYSAVIAEALGWSREMVDQIRMAAPMHDIGKIGIPDAVLQKPGRLTAEEFEVMKTHAAIGAQMLSGTNIPMMNMAAEIARCHHERWDGAGYPEGLKASDIPEGARITTIADVYDALSHERVYKAAYDESTTLTIMSEMAGHHIDPDIYKVFLGLLPEIRRIKNEVTD